MSDEPIVYTMVGVKGDYEGTQYGQFLFFHGDVREYMETSGAYVDQLTEAIGDEVGVSREHQDTDWRARFKVIVTPMTQADMDQYLAYCGDES